MTFKTAGYAVLILIIVHIFTAYIFDAYGMWEDFDIVMHAAGGFVAAMLGLAIHHAVTDRHHFEAVPRVYHYLIVLGFVMLIGVAWEFHEYILDQTVVKWYDLVPTQVSLGDTMLDFLMDAVGGLIAVRVFERKL